MVNFEYSLRSYLYYFFCDSVKNFFIYSFTTLLFTALTAFTTFFTLFFFVDFYITGYFTDMFRERVLRTFRGFLYTYIFYEFLLATDFDFDFDLSLFDF